MIKEFIKSILFWKAISKSKIYRRMRFPSEFKKWQVEPEFYKKFLRSHPSKNNLIFDVGANIGNKSKIFSSLANRVVAFEPSDKLFNFLQLKFKDSNVTLYNCALGSRVAESMMYVVENNEAYNSLNIKHIETTASYKGIANLDSVKRKKIKVDTVENFIQKFGVPKYIKIDVEGYELEVLKGLKTPVPLLSFEANLPEFCNETIQSIKYLDELSPDNYTFNFATGNFFLEENYMIKEDAINYIENTPLFYLEVFARLRL